MALIKRSLAAIGLIAAVTTTAAHADDKVIRIGVVPTMSGPASYGVPTKQGRVLALEEINKTGVNGYKFSVQLKDSACSSQQARVTAKKTPEQYKPHIVIGEECSDATLAIAPILEAARVPLLNVGSTTVKLTESGYKYVFHIFTNAQQQTERLGQRASVNLGAKTAVVLYENTYAGLDTASGFERKFTANGAKVLAKIGFARDVNDCTVIATHMASMGDIDVFPWLPSPARPCA
jgi:branched-chain amino acid transport system substrate-binding protein